MPSYTSPKTNETTTWKEVPMFPITDTSPEGLERAADYLLAANGSMYVADDDDAMTDAVLMDPNQLQMEVDG